MLHYIVAAVVVVGIVCSGSGGLSRASANSLSRKNGRETPNDRRNNERVEAACSRDRRAEVAVLCRDSL